LTERPAPVSSEVNAQTPEGVPPTNVRAPEKLADTAKVAKVKL
jgi:hypothetical protein